MSIEAKARERKRKRGEGAKEGGCVLYLPRAEEGEKKKRKKADKKGRGGAKSAPPVGPQGDKMVNSTDGPRYRARIRRHR